MLTPAMISYLNHTPC